MVGGGSRGFVANPSLLHPPMGGAYHSHGHVEAAVTRVRAALAELADLEGVVLAGATGSEKRASLSRDGRTLLVHLQGSTVFTTDQVLLDVEVWLGSVRALTRKVEWFGLALRLLTVALLVAGLGAAFHLIKTTDYFSTTLSLASFFEKKPLSDAFIQFFPGVLLICLVSATLYASTAIIFTRIRFGIAFAVATYLCAVPVAMGLALYHTAAMTEVEVMRKMPTEIVRKLPKGRVEILPGPLQDRPVKEFQPKGWDEIIGGMDGLASLLKPFLLGEDSDVYVLAFFFTFTLPVSLVVLFGALSALVQAIRGTLAPIAKSPAGPLDAWGGAVLKGVATVCGTAIAALGVLLLALKALRTLWGMI